MYNSHMPRHNALALLTGFEDLAGSGLITEREDLNIEKLTALIQVIMPVYNKTKLDCMCDTE